MLDLHQEKRSDLIQSTHIQFHSSTQRAKLALYKWDWCGTLHDPETGQGCHLKWCDLGRKGNRKLTSWIWTPRHNRCFAIEILWLWLGPDATHRPAAHYSKTHTQPNLVTGSFLLGKLGGGLFLTALAAQIPHTQTAFMSCTRVYFSSLRILVSYSPAARFPMRGRSILLSNPRQFLLSLLAFLTYRCMCGSRPSLDSQIFVNNPERSWGGGAHRSPFRYRPTLLRTSSMTPLWRHMLRSHSASLSVKFPCSTNA